MMDSLFPLSFILCVFAPAVVLPFLSLQIWRFGNRGLTWAYLSATLIWGIFHLFNPYLALWMPDWLSSAYQEEYLVMRFGLLLTYSGFAIHSLFTRSQKSKWVSLALLSILLIDELGAYFGGDYVGP